MEKTLDRRPLIVAIAGPNGAGKTTFFEAFIRRAALRFVNADALALELGVEAYAAAKLAARLREELVAERESFVFETVLSDPVGEKVAFLEAAARSGYTVLLCFIGLNSASASNERVAMRVTQGGHDIPSEKLAARYPRTLENLRRAVTVLPAVNVYDNSDLGRPFELVAEYRDGRLERAAPRLPAWFKRVRALLAAG